METTEEEEEMSALYNKRELGLEKELDNKLERFMRVSYKELVDNGFHSFWFNMKVKEKVLCVYLYYDLDAEDSEKILSWHIYLQTKMNKILDDVSLGKFEAVALIVEAYDLWTS